MPDLPALTIRRAALPPGQSGANLPTWLAMLPPAGPPAPAILCLRQLVGPAPSGRFAPAAARRWGTSLAGGIEAGWQRAARPAAGPVPAAASAVWFADRAELLACLVLDARRGEAAARWWWRSLRLDAAPEQVARALAEAPALLPAVFAKLAVQGEAGAVAAWLPPQATAALAATLAAWFRVSPMVAPAAERMSWVRPVRRDVTGWRSAVPELAAVPAASPATRLLGLALILHRMPGAAADAARALWAMPVPARRIGRAATPLDAAPPFPQAAGAATGPLELTSAAAAPQLVRATGTATAVSSPDSPAGPRIAIVPPLVPRSLDQPAGRAPAASRNPRPGPRNMAKGEASAPDRCATRFGGLLFLLNPILALGLYGDFSAPLAPRPPISPWDLLELLGNRATAGRLRRDPLWPLLAALAGRAPGETPGGGWQPLGWDAPPAWLAGLPTDGPWRIVGPRHAGDRPRHAGDRLRLLHPSGVLALDQPARTARLALFRHRLRQRPRSNGDSRPHGSGLRGMHAGRPTEARATALHAWCGALAVLLDARLGLALGRPAAGTLAWLARRPATLKRTPGQLTATFDLNTHPLALRRAGLDRDPGWIPAAGCDLRFRFVLPGEP